MDDEGKRAPAEIDQVVATTLADGLDDWIPIDWLIANALDVVPQFSVHFKAFFTSALDFLLRNDLMVVGELGKVGFEPWKSRIEDTVERVVRDCEAVDWLPQGSLYWLASTPRGKRQAG